MMDALTLKERGSGEQASLFGDISGETTEVTEIESLCMACEQNGTTRIMAVKIPFYKEVIVSSFSCPHCGGSNNSIMAGEMIQEKGTECSLYVRTLKDLNRTVVMSDVAALKIPELQFEAPYQRQSFGITTVEGVLSRVKEMLHKYANARSDQNDDVTSLRDFVEKMDSYLSVQKPFHLVIDDPSGNSFIENPSAPNIDHDLSTTNYIRSPEQDSLCGLKPSEVENVADEVLVFPATCYNCHLVCETNMKTVQVPHFKEILIMSTVCDKCGWRNNEAKPASGIEDEGVEVELHVLDQDDLNRDVIKSSTCALHIPELEFEMLSSDHSSRYTTVEGLLSNIKDELVSNNPFVHGDSANAGTTDKLAFFGKSIDEVIAGKRPVHIILNDPAGNSFIQKNLNVEIDDRLKIRKFKRTLEQDEDLGINLMNTENYDGMDGSSDAKPVIDNK